MVGLDNCGLQLSTSQKLEKGEIWQCGGFLAKWRLVSDSGGVWFWTAEMLFLSETELVRLNPLCVPVSLV